MTLNYYGKYAALTLLIQLFSTWSAGADFGDFNALIIGRSQLAGVQLGNSVRYKEDLFKEEQVYHVSPDTEGDRSERNFFPCALSPNMPKNFQIVLIDQGVLNEFVTSAFGPPRSLDSFGVAKLRFANPDWSDANEIELQQLKEARFPIWQRWTELRNDLESLRKASSDERAISELEARVLEISEELQAIDKVSDKLYKTKIGWDNDRQIQKYADGLTTEISSEPQITLVRQSDDDFIEPESAAVFERVKEFMTSAWNLVADGGELIVFKGNGEISDVFEGGMSKDFIKENLIGHKSIEQYKFGAQNREGQKYFCNPVIPAKMNIWGWAGSRPSGKFFVIKK